MSVLDLKMRSGICRLGDVNFLVETIVAPMPWCYAATGI